MDNPNRQLEELRRLFLYRWFFSSFSYDRKYFPRAEEVEIIPNHGPLYRLVPLGENSMEYKTVKKRMGMDDIRILSISKIENEFLKRSYQLKKEQRRMNGWINFERKLFHGTKQKSAENICRENFNWRMNGKRSRKCLYGKGVYFTPDATISRKYPRGTEGERYMLLSKVLIGKYRIGTPEVVIPPTDIDTTVSRNLKEIVKYEDNEFCPTYRIVFMIGNHRKDDIEIDGMESNVDTQSIPFRTLTSISQQLALNFTEVHSSTTNDFGFNYPGDIEEDYYSDYSETSSDESISDDSGREIEGQARTTDEIYYVPSESWLASSIGGIFQILRSIWYELVPQMLKQSSEESESDSTDSDYS